MSKAQQKAQEKSVMAVEGSGDSGPIKKTKAEGPGKEATECTDCQVVVTSEKTGKSDGPYC